MGFSGTRAGLRVLIAAIAAAAGALAIARGLYATMIVAAGVAGWMIALATIEAGRPPLPAPPAPPAADEAERRRLRAYLDLSPAPLVELDAADRLRAINRAARRLFDAADHVSHPPPALLAALVADPPGRTATVELPRAGGLARFAVATGDALHAGGRVRFGALIDIDAQLRANESAALREMVHVLSHEIVNALTPIASLARTAADMLDDGEPARATLRDAIETVARRAEGLRHFGESYRALARLPRPVLAPVRIDRLIADLAQLFAARWPGIALERAVPPALPAVAADAHQLDAALWALLQNAAEAGAERLELAARESGGGVVLTIADDGPGIAPGDAARIFQPFYTTRADGTGVGLPLARQIFRGHGGDLTLDAAADGAAGARFRATLPVRE